MLLVSRGKFPAETIPARQTYSADFSFSAAKLQQKLFQNEKGLAISRQAFDFIGGDGGT